MRVPLEGEYVMWYPDLDLFLELLFVWFRTPVRADQSEELPRLSFEGRAICKGERIQI
jgi:hypothetical protein